MTAVRCGRCIAGEHSQCVVSITMGTPRALYKWHCECACQAVDSRPARRAGAWAPAPTHREPPFRSSARTCVRALDRNGGSQCLGV